MFKAMLRERKQNGLKYNDLSETIENAIEKGLAMDEQTKLGNCLLGKYIRSVWFDFERFDDLESFYLHP